MVSGDRVLQRRRRGSSRALLRSKAGCKQVAQGRLKVLLLCKPPGYLRLGEFFSSCCRLISQKNELSRLFVHECQISICNNHLLGGVARDTTMRSSDQPTTDAVGHARICGENSTGLGGQRWCWCCGGGSSETRRERGPMSMKGSETRWLTDSISPAPGQGPR